MTEELSFADQVEQLQAQLSKIETEIFTLYVKRVMDYLTQSHLATSGIADILAFYESKARVARYLYDHAEKPLEALQEMAVGDLQVLADAHYFDLSK